MIAKVEVVRFLETFKTRVFLRKQTDFSKKDQLLVQFARSGKSDVDCVTGCFIFQKFFRSILEFFWQKKTTKSEHWKK